MILIERTVSAMVGKGSTRHNSRKFMADNIVKERSSQNVEYCNEKIEDVYHQLFDEALERFNAKQKRNDRKIDDYYEKIRSGKQERNSLKNGKLSRISRKKALLLIAKARAVDPRFLLK